MKAFGERLLDRRAERVCARLSPHLPKTGRVLDIGSGTGHNGRCLRERFGLEVHEVDVCNLSLVGPGPELFDGAHLDSDDESYDGVLLLYVLQFAADPAALLAEARRVSAGPVLLLQSTCRDAFARAVWRGRDFVLGRGALACARCAGWVPPGVASMSSARAFSRDDLRALAARAGFRSTDVCADAWPVVGLSRDLWVLNR